MTSGGIIPLKFRDEEIQNSIVLTMDNYRSAIITTIYYMLKYNAFVVVKAGGATTNKNVFYASLYGLHDDAYKDACLGDKIGGSIITEENLYKTWSEDMEGLYDIEDIPPFYLFHNRDQLKELFNIIFLLYDAKVLEGKQYI